MERTVNAGMRNTTVTLDGTECAVKFSANYRCFEVMNDSDDDVAVSVYEGKTAGEDGVLTVHAGMSATVAHMRTDIDTVYITGSGTVQVAAKNSAEPVFKIRSGGGDGNANLKVGDKINYNKIDPSWSIQTNGISVRDNLRDITYYNTVPGSVIYVKATDNINDCKFVWANVPSISSQNLYHLVGDPVTKATEGFIVVPDGAYCIAFSVLKTDTETGVYAVKI